MARRNPEASRWGPAEEARHHGRWDVVQHVKERRAQIASALGIEVGALLGCGRGGGCVFASNPGTVLKLTDDAREVAGWQAVFDLQQRRPLPGFPTIYRIAELKPSSPATPRKLFAIVREDVRPLLRESGYAFEVARIWEEYAAPQPLSFKRREIEEEGTPEDLERFDQDYEERMIDLEDDLVDSTRRYHRVHGNVPEVLILNAGRAMRRFVSSAKALMQHVWLIDVHAGNFGYRDYDPVSLVLFDFEAPERKLQSWEVLQANARSKQQVYDDWKQLVNMTPRELERFLARYGTVAGLSRAEAQRQGIRSGRDSARAILRMKPKGKSFASAERNWTEADWKWARRQVSFIKRMRGTAGPLYDDKGEPTRKLLSLLVWGHDPEK
jgi:hypothetical protein